MSGFNRLCTAVFSLAGLFSLGALALTWYGPWTDVARILLVVEGYSLALLVCLVVSVVGLVVLLMRALLSRRTRTVEVALVDGGVISVTRDAIAAQAAYIVEADGTCSAERVHVDAKPTGHVRVHVRVLPHETVDVVAKGTKLHAELVSGLAAVCGDTVEGVSLEFVEPRSVTLTALEPAEDQGLAADDGQGRDTSVPTDSTSEITVPMSAVRETEKEA